MILRRYTAEELNLFSENDLEKLNVDAQKSYRINLNFNVLNLAFIVGSGLGGLIIATGSLRFLAFGIAAIAFGFFANTWANMSLCERLREQLRLLSELPDDTCAEALAIVKRSPVSQAYVAAATKRGRQLRVFDYIQIQHLAIQAENERVNLKRRQVCNELHGIVD